MKRIAVLSFVVAAFLASAGTPARAIFENDLVYGYDAVTYSLGGAGAVASDHPLAYLLNPALLTEARSNHVSLSFARFDKKEVKQRSYKGMILGYTRPGRNAFTFATTELDPGPSKTRYTYTMTGKPTSSFIYGVNIHFLKAEVGNEDANGFSVDLGTYWKNNETFQYGASLQNVISNLSELTTTTNLGNYKKIPSYFTIGASYKYRDNMKIVGGYQTTFGSKDQVSTVNQDVSNITLGVIYDIPSDMSARGLFSKMSLGNEETDDMAVVGFGMKMDAARIDYAGIQKNQNFDSPNIISASYDLKYKKNGDGRGRKGDLKDRAITKKKLKAIDPDEDKKKEEEAAQKARALKPTEAEEEKKPASLELTLSTPKALMAPLPNQNRYGDLLTHWAGPSVSKLLNLGFYKSDNGADFHPDAQGDRIEFFQLLFDARLYSFFGRPIDIAFSLSEQGDYDLKAVLKSQKTGREITLRESQERDISGGSLSLEREIARANSVTDGKYDLIVSLKNKDGQAFEGSDRLYIYDSFAGLFAGYKAMSRADRESRLEILIKELQGLGVDLSFLKQAALDGPVTRLEAARVILQAFGVQFLSPSVAKDAYLPFTDIAGLGDIDRQAVYISTRGLKPLNGVGVFSIAKDGFFRPEKVLNRGEMAALIARLVEIGQEDLMPPYAEPAKAAPAIAQAQPSSQLIAAPPASQQQLKKAAAPAASGKYVVIAASALSMERIESANAGLRTLGYAPQIMTEPFGDAVYYHAAVGVYNSKETAEQAWKKLKDMGYTPTVRALAAAVQMPQAYAAPAPSQNKPVSSGASRSMKDGEATIAPGGADSIYAPPKKDKYEPSPFFSEGE